MSDEIKFGVMFRTSGPLNPSEFATKAEALGYDSVWAAETPCNREPNYDPVVSLSMAAAVTSRVTLGTNVLITPLHHPAWMAKEWASLDALSGGRVRLGLGVGGDAAGLGSLQFDLFDIPVNERGKRTNEAIEAMKKLWIEESADFHGEFFDFEGIVMEPRPVQRPHPPIWIGGRPGGHERGPNGEWRFKSKLGAIQRAAAYGDGWSPFYVSPTQYKDSVEAIKDRADRIGRDVSHMEWGLMTHWIVRDSFEEALKFASEGDVPAHVSGAGSAEAGTGYRYGRELGKRVANYEILGNAKNAIERLEKYVDAGARHFICNYRCPWDEIPAHMELIARDVIPHFR
jgi:probable F420-dependent oxidoreductase